ncbi:MAG: hypothetical protein ACK41C_07650 [Phenylobacterium sp.]|jgi:hypothetical protein|uniref:hypothetical protein n=1 Tax=Phenylobacterium sp. TaxID=1871053 RepID=UPI003919309E
MFAALPLLALPVVIYNLVALAMPGGVQAVDAGVRLAAPLFTVRMSSHVDWPVSLGDVLLGVGLIVLFVELLKSTESRGAAIVNHALSMLLFIACLVEFLLFPAFATSVFFLLGVMVLLDVLAGFIVTIVAARRDIDFGPGAA